MSTEWGDLERRLRGLGSDIGGAPLPGPDAARHRARQRTRRQVAGAAVGIAAAALGVIALGGLGPLSISQPEPADTPTPTPSPTGDLVEPGGELALTVEDLEASSGADEPVGWRQATNPPKPFACAPTPGDADRVIERWFETPEGGYLHQVIEISTPDRAQQRFDDLTAEITSCVQAGGEEFVLDQVWTIDEIGDRAWIARYWAPPRTEELATLVTISMAQVGDSLTTVSQGGLAMDANGPPDDNVASIAATRLCEATGGQCEFAGQPQRIFPEAQPDVPGWLTVDDVVAATGFDHITEGSGVADAGGDWGFACLTNNPVANGAGSVEVRTYSDPTWQTDAPVSQSIAVFPSDQQAQDHFEALVGDANACDQGDTVEEIGQVSGDGYVGVAWRSTNEEFGTSFVFGVVVNGPAVSFVSFAEDEFLDLHLGADQAAELLDRAGQRLAGRQ
jgi:hypothetical protein